MADQDKPVYEEYMAVGKGILYGILFGILLWAAIIGGFYLLLK